MSEKLDLTIEAIKEIGSAFKQAGLPLETAGTTINTYLMSALSGVDRPNPARQALNELTKNGSEVSCLHEQTTDFSGVSKKTGKPYSGKKCLKCEAVNWGKGWESKK
jgi:hypothetical protein